MSRAEEIWIEYLFVIRKPRSTTGPVSVLAEVDQEDLAEVGCKMLTFALH